MSFIKVRDGAEIFYKDWGPHDAQAIMFHHGWPLSADELGQPDDVLPGEGLSRDRA